MSACEKAQRWPEVLELLMAMEGQRLRRTEPCEELSRGYDFRGSGSNRRRSSGSSTLVALVVKPRELPVLTNQNASEYGMSLVRSRQSSSGHESRRVWRCKCPPPTVDVLPVDP